MPNPSHHRSLLSDSLPADPQVIEAVVARFQKLAGAVTRFCRTICDNPQLLVRLGSESAASSDEIVLDPGLFQAAASRSAPVTPDEVALASALHEAVHLAVTNFDEPRPLPEGWSPEGARRTAEPLALLDALEIADGQAAVALFLALEDARQELHHLSHYPGARSVLVDLYRAGLGAAIDSAGPLGQFALGCFLLVGDYVTRDELNRVRDPRVSSALADAEPFLDRVIGSTDAWEVGSRALELLALARLHGLVTGASNTETSAQRELRQRREQTGIVEAIDRVRLLSPILHSASSYERTRLTAPAGDQPGDTKPAGDPAIEQILRVSDSPTVYPPSGQRGKLLVTPIPHRFALFSSQGSEALAETALRWGVEQREISGELWPVFVANQRRGLRSGYDAGDLSPHAALFLGAGLYQRMFERRQLPSRRSYAVSLLIDGSASMLQPRLLPDGRRQAWSMAAACLGAWALARLAHDLQLDFEVALFNRSFAPLTDDSEASYRRRLHTTQASLKREQGGAADRLARTVNHYLVKSFEQPWRSGQDTLAGLFYTAARPQEAAAQVRANPEVAPPISMFDKAANVDEYNVHYAVSRLGGGRGSVRMLVVLADGMTRGSREALKATVAAAEHTGTTVLGIGIGDTSVAAAYTNHRLVSEPGQLALAMVNGVRGVLRRNLLAWGGTAWWTRSEESRI